METLELVDGRILVPKDLILSEKNRRLHVKFPWNSQIEVLNKDNFTVTKICYFRRAPQKPFVPVGFVEINKVRFILKEPGFFKLWMYRVMRFLKKHESN